MKTIQSRVAINWALLSSLLLSLLTLAGFAHAQVVEAEVEDLGTSVEACIGCHSPGSAVPVDNVASVFCSDGQ